MNKIARLWVYILILPRLIPKSGHVAPLPLDCDVSTENAKTVLSITCMGLKKGQCSNCQKVELLE